MSSKDVRLELIERQIEALGEGTPEYHEALAFYCTIMAKRQWILAEEARKRRAKLRRGRTQA